ncbi:hypothetical protein GJW-30_1_03342 [Variibacter gotjawalensis]|uniref:DUF2268 domain-containing protein n=1 Tax=Variibacter gotjawalensis TaxID=1333996 RepID=A0A0S3PXW0_9BRAD|nr:DUF2268 domain-containing putative Zn-dependent protease [Variibacter gotjawalensis]NIK46627.1 hypothetical protein [Variibacter gotjawalensis]RZS48530.1 putative Zn-dependent protease DUF2268 [Variibacter gotjawalensis]BAT60792.1 hypothetical protein GJW-30_1_03342 [Variibacter gotjawalensis]
MSVRFVPLDAGSEFAPGRLTQLVGYLEAALADVGPPIDAKNVDVLLTPTHRPIAGWDAQGFAQSAHLITIGVDPRCDGREKGSIALQLRAQLAHELHHATRFAGPGYGTTLGEALISEGLAQCYEEEVGCPTPNYAVEVSGVPLRQLAANAIGELSAVSYDHPKWFFGTGNSANFPRWGGYSLGYALVKAWLNESGTTASKAVAIPVSEILPQAFELFGEKVEASAA